MRNARLVEARKALGLTQAEMAERAGISRAYYALLENGDRQPSLPVATKLSEITGLPTAIFLVEEVSLGHMSSE